MQNQAKEWLGCQIWIEPNDTQERVDMLVKQAADSGIGWLRCFLMWPWIEENPGEWDFQAFDYLFDAAEKYGIKIKATLTANSGGWHLGTPSLLHSHTGFLSSSWRKPMQEYIEKCVMRYRKHPALGQWILWNEPSGGFEQTDETLPAWQGWLSKEYDGDLKTLNKRWRTGFPSFEEIVFPKDIMHPLHRGNSWQSYRPTMDHCRFAAEWLAQELEWIQAEIRRFDTETPTCVNPAPFLSNQAACGVDLEKMGSIVDVLGASYHPAWQFTFTEREKFTAVMSVGVRKKATVSTAKAVEVTEVQTGNTLNSSTRPCAVEPSELARFYLSSIFSGAQSVTGWLLNTRSRDFEAGDWGLLDDMDMPSVRSNMMRRIHDRLQNVIEKTGTWSKTPARAFVGYSLQSQTVETADSFCKPVNGRGVDDSAFGATLLSAALMELGVDTEMRLLNDIPSGGEGEMLVLSHVVAWEKEDAEKILSFAKNGGTVVIDATSGRKDTDAQLHRPWPGFLTEEIAMHAKGLETNPQGYAICDNGAAIGNLLLTRVEPDFTPEAGWHSWEDVRYADGTPLVWQRDFGYGKFVLVNGMAGPSLVHEKAAVPVIKRVFDRLCENMKTPIRPVSAGHSGFSLTQSCEKGELTAIFAAPIQNRDGQSLRIIAPAGKYTDIWTGKSIEIDNSGEIALLTEDGIVLLWKE
jgi:Beta-galactosidase